MRKILIVKDLHAGYGDYEVLKGVSLTIYEGEKVVLMGPSGSGKSTLLRCVVRLHEPWKGEIYLNGYKVTDKKADLRKIRQMTGFVFQSYNLFPHLTVLRNITLPLEIVKKMPREKADEKALSVLKIVGMEAFKDKYPLQLSGGQQQRVAIARALAMDPILLLLDEPTSALDPELREEVLDTLTKIASRGIAMLIVTHELDFAEHVADRLMVFDHGVIIEEGPPEQVIYSPRTARAKKFLRILAKRTANVATM